MTKKFLLYGKAKAIVIQFVEFSDGTQSFIKYWFDLRSLNNIIFESKFKIIVHQEEKPLMLGIPDIYVATIVESPSRAEAIEDNLTDLNVFLANLSILLGISFHLSLDGITCLDITDKTVNDLNDFDFDFNKEFKIVWTNSIYFKPTENEGTVETLGTTINQGYIGSIKNDSILYFFFTHVSTNANDIKVAAIRIPADKINNIVDNYSILSGKINDYNSLTDLYNEAISLTNLRSSYLLLWQIIENLGEIEPDTSSRLISIQDLDELQKFFEKKGYDQEIINQRIINMLRSMKTQNLMDRIIQGVKIVFPNYTFDDDILKSKFRKFREIRGRVVHPLESREIYFKAIISSYLELRNIIKELFSSLN